MSGQSIATSLHAVGIVDPFFLQSRGSNDCNQWRQFSRSRAYWLFCLLLSRQHWVYFGLPNRLILFDFRRKSNKLSTGHQHHNRSFDAGQPSKRTTVYAYSSSDESLNLSFAAQPTSQQDDETVETLCELPLSNAIHHSTSTPSLAVGSHWLTVGSSSSTPRPLSGKGRSGQPYSVVGSTSTDDPPGLQHQYQLLLQETAAIKTTLSGLEADFGASRRDMGWLQENLTTVQSAASGVSDKVIKMQSQVANMERQICGAVKVHQLFYLQ